MRLGLGTYRIDDAAESARIAVAAGGTLIDTAPVYGHGAHHQALAPVLAEHPSTRVSSKVGHMTAQQAQYAEAAGALTEEETNQRHSIAPAYVRYQAQLTAFELGRAPDVLYLHNPDHHAHHDRASLHGRIRDAFVALERMCDRGFLLGYGVATWSGFAGAFTVADLVRLSREASGGTQSGLVAIQLPVSLVNIAPVKDALNGIGPLIEAREAELQVWASAPLHGGKLVHLVNAHLARYISEGASPAEAALLVTASAPGLTGMLISTSNTEHWKSAATVAGDSPLSETRLKDISDLLLSRDNV